VAFKQAVARSPAATNPYPQGFEIRATKHAVHSLRMQAAGNRCLDHDPIKLNRIMV